MLKKRAAFDSRREWVKGIFFFKRSASQADCRQLVEDLGCKIIVSGGSSVTIQSTRDRLASLKQLHDQDQDDRAQISSRLKSHFERILIGGPVR